MVKLKHIFCGQTKTYLFVVDGVDCVDQDPTIDILAAAVTTKVNLEKNKKYF